MGRWIYLDNNATTQPLPEVAEAMQRQLCEGYANPSSVHRFGQVVRHDVEIARGQVAALIGADAKEVIFTSGGTESINLALRGAIAALPERRQVVTATAEHSAVLRVVEQLEHEGVRIGFLGVDGEGRIDVDAFRAMVTPETGVVSLIHANNETGVITDLEPLLAHAESVGALVHLDAVQSAGKLPIDVSTMPVHLLSLAAHKFHGPKGVGALYIRRRTKIVPVLRGGTQERNLRGGTENAAGIAGMGRAAELAARCVQEKMPQITALRDDFERRVCAAIPCARVIGSGAPRIGNTSNIGFAGLQADAILMVLSEAGICVSSGAACSSGSLEPSHVLKAMGVDPHIAHGAIRFSLSRLTTREEIDRAVELMPGLLGRLTALSAS